MKRRVSMLVALLAAVLVGIFCPGESSARSPASSKCATGEYRQFDFWTGDWDAYGLDEGNKLVARARVDVILDGCALLEVYEQLDGLTGQSLSIYDASRGTWHQTWVTNRGKLLTLEGRFQDGRMTLTGADRSADGRPILIRGVWKRAEAGVRETAETSEDGGKSWKPLFDILFRARPPASKASSADDEKTVAALDTQLWFSDTYVRTPSGWRYVFGQASSPLPDAN